MILMRPLAAMKAFTIMKDTKGKYYVEAIHSFWTLFWGSCLTLPSKHERPRWVLN